MTHEIQSVRADDIGLTRGVLGPTEHHGEYSRAVGARTIPIGITGDEIAKAVAIDVEIHGHVAQALARLRAIPNEIRLVLWERVARSLDHQHCPRVASRAAARSVM